MMEDNPIDMAMGIASSEMGLDKEIEKIVKESQDESRQDISQTEDDSNISQVSDYEVEKLIETMKEDPGNASVEILNRLNEKQIAHVYSETVYRRLETSDDPPHTVISLYNVRDKFIRRECMTSLVGFIFAVFNEYEFESEEKREATREFLSTYFEFDPNIHVKSAYDEKLAQKDPERAKTVKARRKILKNRNKQKSIDMENLTKNTPITEIPTHTMQDLPMTKSQALGETNEPDGEEKFVIPPMDTFHRWRNYHDVNYEEIRIVTNQMYAEKPDIEFALNVHKHFKNKADAQKYLDKNQDLTPYMLIDVTDECFCFLGPFKKNRERIQFYNKHTHALKSIMEQAENDEKLGAELMKKRVQKNKRKNIKEQGADDPGLNTYSGLNNTAMGTGAEQVISHKEKVAMAEEINRQRQVEASINIPKSDDEVDYAKDSDQESEESEGYSRNDNICNNTRDNTCDNADESDDEVPNDAVEVGMFIHDGEGGFTQTKFYTEADSKETISKQIKEREKRSKR